MVRRVAVIGAGGSGLTCIKACLDEGLEPVCFESTEDIGGLWNYKVMRERDRSRIYRSLVANTSKEIMCFSDFPMPEDFPNYMPNSQYLQYLRLYADHFNLLRHISFQTKVKSVSQRSDFSTSGQWDVVTVNEKGDEERHVFDAVLVCSGHFTSAMSPLGDFRGNETFSGRCLHSWEYEDADAYRGKKVVVVGIGNSAGDIAVEISRSAEKTFLSTRQGTWVVSRMAANGLPLDMTVLTRFNNVLMQLLPKTLVNWVMERSVNSKYDHKLYALKPKHRFLDRRPLINDDLPGRILHGAIVMKPNLKEFRDSAVVFEDGTVEENIAAVVFCTGYKSAFPFLPPALFEEPHGDVTLYKRVFPPSLKHPTLAIIGLFQAKGPIMPAVEMQARWAVKVFSGSCRLPPKDRMHRVIEFEKKRIMKTYTCPRQDAVLIDFIPYLDFMARQVGAHPNLLWLLLKDPVLWAKVFFGPCTPYQYRLSGPNRWPGARDAILTQWERVAKPFRTRRIPEPETKAKASSLCFPWFIVTAGSLLITVIWFKNKVAAGIQPAALCRGSWLPGSG